jgi:hypothetical protein
LRQETVTATAREEEMTNIANMDNTQLQNTYWAVAQEIDRRGGRVDSYAAPHVWNLVAKILRESAPAVVIGRNDDESRRLYMTVMAQISDTALMFAKRFAEDDGFEPISWLDKCSPDPEMYPFSELWDEPDPADLEFN